MQRPDQSALFTITALLLLLGTLVTPSAVATGPRVSADLFTPPVNEIFAVDLPPFVGSGLPGGGLAAEIVAAALTAVQVEAVLTPLPLSTMVRYYLTQENALAVLAPDLGDAERVQGIVIPLFVALESYWYHRSADSRPLDWEGCLASLAGHTYGAHRGEAVDAYRAAGIRVEHAWTRDLLRRLAQGRVDFIRLPDLTARWMIERHFPGRAAEFGRLTPAAGEQSLSVLFNQGHRDGGAMALRFRRGLGTILGNGRYLELLEAHLGRDPANVGRVDRLRGLLSD